MIFFILYKKRPKKDEKVQNKKSGSKVNFLLLGDIYIQKFQKFLWTVPKKIFDELTHWQTDRQTNKGESISCFVLQPGSKKVPYNCLK